MLPKEDRKAMLLRIYNDSSPLMDHSKDRFKTYAKENGDENGDSSPAAKDAEDEQVQDAKEEDDEESALVNGDDLPDAEMEARAEADTEVGLKDEEEVSPKMET